MAETTPRGEKLVGRHAAELAEQPGGLAAMTKVVDANRKVKTSFEDLGDAILSLSYSGNKAFKSMVDNSAKIKKLKGNEAFMSAMLANNQYKVAQTMAKSATGVASLGNMFSKLQLGGKGGASIRPVTAMLTQAVDGSGALANALKFVNPQLARFAMGAAGLGTGPFVALAATFMVLANVFKKTWQSGKDFTKALGYTRSNFMDSVKWTGAVTTASALWNVKQEEMATIMGTLGDSMAMTSFSAKKFGNDFAVVAGNSIGEFMGMAKYAGMSAGEAGKLASSLTMLGFSTAKLPQAFGQFQQWVGETELTPNLLMESLGDIAPVSLTSASAAQTMIGTFKSFKRTFSDSTDPIIKFLRNAPAGAKLMGDAMQSFGKAAASLTVPEMMAFGGGGGQAGANPWEAVQSALAEGNDRSQILTNYIQKAAAMSGGGADAQKMTIFAMLTQRFGVEMSRANVLTKMLYDLNEDQVRLEKEGKTSDAEHVRKQMSAQAAMGEALTDPMDKVVNLLSTLVLKLFPMFMDRLGMNGSAMTRNVAQATAGHRQPANTSQN